MHSKTSDHRQMYGRLAIMIGLSFVWMYAAMFAMVDVPQNVLHNVNFVYMAALMAGAMLPIELLVMRKMYPDRRLSLAAGLLGVVIIAGSFLAIRAQTAVGDDQFLDSMIPHHAAALLMCKRAQITDAEIRDLCAGIVESQQREIDQMRSIIERRGRE